MINLKYRVNPAKFSAGFFLFALKGLYISLEKYFLCVIIVIVN